MNLIKKIETYRSIQPSVVTIGTFDGVHIGHQKIIKRLIDTAKSEGLKSIVLTFFPHPRMVLQKDTRIKLIHSIAERHMILSALGLDDLLTKEFSKEFSRLSAEDFVRQILVEKLNAKKIIIGYDHRFGRNRNADITDLIQFGKTYGFEVEEISAQDIDDVSVSSTKIRKALNDGHIAIANSYLGHLFKLTGRVVKGKGLGKKLGFPTANIQVKETYKMIPKQGVYIVKSVIGQNVFYGMMNIGTNPTVNGHVQSIEVHFFNFNADIYDTVIAVDFLERIRDEVKFSSIEALKSQLGNDEQKALAYIAKNRT